jgi:protein TonB
MPRAQARTAPTAARAAGSTAIAAPERAEGESAATALSQPSPEPIPEPAPSTPGYLDDRRLPDVDIPVLVDPTWYTAKDLDLYPQPLAPVEPAHPASVPDIAGEVTLLLSIDEFGVVQELSVVTAEPAGHFEQPALQAFNGVRFAPAQRDGRPVRSRIVLKVRFAPSMRDSDAR